MTQWRNDAIFHGELGGRACAIERILSLRVKKQPRFVMGPCVNVRLTLLPHLTRRIVNKDHYLLE
jgi:hypothetical protein